ncbi:hypothetical protein [Gracilibacillus alcaliphilus]|uniref:hypothetical protein n=1 Tax=Gracilibacillus alcaliphilus TaxID=1401441 RepID=UPI00195C6245|nr:hypothetical protein [Gracilibacillus alcaliphilus]MBM7676646.1 Leucine-rich repeat (LRR) protein [Gracilibacillus alcaliphilus]
MAFTNEELEFLKGIWVNRLEWNQNKKEGESLDNEIMVAAKKELSAVNNKGYGYMHYYVPFDDQQTTENKLKNNVEYTKHDLLTILQVINHNLFDITNDPTPYPEDTEFHEMAEHYDKIAKLYQIKSKVLADLNE